MVVSTSFFVPHPGPAAITARMGLPALALLLAVGLLHTQVSQHGWEVWKKCMVLSCQESSGTVPGSALLSFCMSLLFLLWLPSPAARVPPPCPACTPSSLPALPAPVPQNATSSAAGCLISEGGVGIKWLPCLSLLLSRDSVVPASSLHWLGLGWGGCLQPPSTAPLSHRPPPQHAPSSWITRRIVSVRMVSLSATSQAASTTPVSRALPGGTGSSRCT